jgi:hypothetical protein
MNSLRLLYNARYRLLIFRSIINELHALDLAGKVLNIDQFSSFVKTHQALLFPAFQMQSALRRNILGAGFWESHANKRIKFTNGKYVSVGQFIVAVSVDVNVGRCGWVVILLFWAHAAREREGASHGTDACRGQTRLSSARGRARPGGGSGLQGGTQEVGGSQSDQVPLA